MSGRLNLSIDNIDSADDLESVINGQRLKYENHVEPEKGNTPEDVICICLSSQEQAMDPYASYSFEIEYSYDHHNYKVITTRSPEEIGSEYTFDNAFSGPHEVAEYISSYSVKKWFNNKLTPEQRDLIEAILNDRYYGVKALTERGMDINFKDINGSPCLITAVKNCDYKITELLLNCKPEIEITDNENNTALLWSVIKNKNDVFRLLVQHGADIYAVNSYGENGLMTAASNDNSEALKFFLDHHFDINLKNSEGLDSLNIAISMGHEKTARILIENGAGLKPEDAQKHLLKSSESGYDEITAFLIEYVKDIDKPSSPEPDNPLPEMTPLMNAAYLGHNKIIELLIKNGADPEKKNSEGKTALMYAAEGNHARSVKLLLDAGAKIETAGNNGENALRLALESCSTTSAGYLIKRGAKTDSVKEPNEIIKQCIETMEQEKETLEQLIQNDLNSTE